MKKTGIEKFATYLTLLISTIMLLSGCKNNASAQQIAFDTGRGTGSNDNMTYSEFESLTMFTPKETIKIKSINPEINYCNGTCGYIIQITDQNGQVLGYQTGQMDAKDQSNPPLPERFLNNQVELLQQNDYLIFIKVWSTESVGIYTTGNRINGITGSGDFKTEYSRSSLLFSSMPPNEITDRGSVSFQLVN
jgi:hypothetical protein